MHPWSLRVGPLVATLALIACTSAPASSDGGADADATSQLDASDAPVTSDGDDATPPPDALGLWPTGGEVSVTIANFGTGPSVSAAAAFWNPSSNGTGVNCSYRVDGACTVRNCTPSGNSTAPNAGDITMSVDSAVRLTLTVGTNGLYGNAGRGVAVWSPGAMITFDAAGGDVSAFRGTLVSPEPLTVISPDPMAATVNVSRSSGFAAQWMPGTGMVRVSIRQQRQIGTSALQGGVTVECFFDRSAGTGTVPATTLTDFASATGATPNAEVLVFAVAAQNVIAGGASVLTMANTGGLYLQGFVQ